MNTRAVRGMIELDDGSHSHSILSHHDHDAQKTSSNQKNCHRCGAVHFPASFDRDQVSLGG